MDNKIPNLKVVFLGTPQFVDPVLKTLEKNFNVILKIRNPKDLDTQGIKKLKPDLFVVASFGKILSADVLAIPKYGAINIHPSLLPKYRGPTPVQTAILNGEGDIGLSFILMDDKVDHGPLLYQENIAALGNKTADEALKIIFEDAAKLLPQIVSKYLATKHSIPQNATGTTYTKLFTKQDGFVDISNPPFPQELKRMIRAFCPWPSVWTKTKLGGKERVVKFLPENKIQVEGKKEMSYKDFINGYPEGVNLLKQLQLESD